jgi:hypothetical protein
MVAFDWRRQPSIHRGLRRKVGCRLLRHSRQDSLSSSISGYDPNPTPPVEGPAIAAEPDLSGALCDYHPINVE